MLLRLKTCLCHPKFIGAFFKDKAYKVIITILIVLIAYLGTCLGKNLTTEYFTKSDNQYISKMIVEAPETDISFDGKKMSGSEVKISNSEGYYTLYFMTSSNKSYSVSGGINIFFKEEYALIYYGTIKLNSLEYSSILGLSEFTLNDVRESQTDANIAFEYLISQALKTVNISYGLCMFLENTIRGIVYYLIIVIIVFIISRFINPTIGTGVRIKLSLYSSLIYYLIMIFSIMFSLSWLSYVAFVLPVIYSFRTFTHIIRKPKQ